MSEDIGQGWVFYPVQDIYKFNHGEFNVAGDIVRNAMRDWSRKVEEVHLIAVLNKLYRMSRGIQEL